MGIGKTLLLGFIAGATILIGMPLGRMRRPSEALRVTLNALAVGILLFLVWDVLSAAWEPIDAALASVHEGHGGLGTAIGYGDRKHKANDFRSPRAELHEFCKFYGFD